MTNRSIANALSILMAHGYTIYFKPEEPGPMGITHFNCIILPPAKPGEERPSEAQEVALVASGERPSYGTRILFAIHDPDAIETGFRYALEFHQIGGVPRDATPDPG